VLRKIGDWKQDMVNNPTAGIILAAGMSTRLGRTKQLLKLKNKYLLEWVIDAALASQLQSVVLVLGHEHRKILKALGAKICRPRIQVVVSHDYIEGQSQSLQAGLIKVQHAFPSVMFLLCDQPLLDPKIIDRMLTSFWNSDKDICVPVFKGQRGNPTIFNCTMYPQLLAIQGDIGARDLIRKNPVRILYIEVDDPFSFFDIDSEKDFNNIQALLE
jgi:molybdenum cofactor cytidylyltransferase